MHPATYGLGCPNDLYNTSPRFPGPSDLKGPRIRGLDTNFPVDVQDISAVLLEPALGVVEGS